MRLRDRVVHKRDLGISLALFATLLCQQVSAQGVRGVSGVVRDAGGALVADADVGVKAVDGKIVAHAKSDEHGSFRFASLSEGDYQIVAKKDGLMGQTEAVMDAGSQAMEPVVVRLAAPRADADGMQFADEPGFTVAGVTDWTAAGGHGSDTSLRTSEALTDETVHLQAKSDDGLRGVDPATALQRLNASIAQKDDADLHRLRGQVEEKQGDALAAVRDFETAVRMRPSEENYFAWGSELLLHRAVLQAEVVLSRGAEKYPTSLRMQVALATALFSGARYEEAAERLCKAADLDGGSREVLAMMGKVQIAAPNALSCIDDRLDKYEQQHPEDGQAKYLDAMALEKRQQATASNDPRIQKLLTDAVAQDPKCADAYLALGNMLAERKEYSQAIEEYERAIAVDPELADAHYRLGVAYDRSGDRAKAAQEFALHDALKKTDAEKVERERREIKQFQVVGTGEPAMPPGA